MMGIARFTGAAGLSLVLAGCTLGSMFGGGGDAGLANTSASPAQLAQSAPAVPALATQCPPIRVRQGTSAHRVFAGNRSSDASALRYQAVIDDIARNCVVSPGRIAMRIGVAGRVVPGPSGAPASVNLPLRFAVERDGMAVFSQRYDAAVALSGGGTEDFSFTADDVAIPYLGGETITIWVGFDS